VPSIADNVRSMALLVASIRRDTKLSENSILRIVDMNFALAQQQPEAFGAPMPEEDDLPEPQQMTLFPEPEAIEGDEEVLAAVTEPTPITRQQKRASARKES